jgi:hypothetical protein
MTEARSDARANYLEKKIDYLDARVDSCQANNRNQARAFKRTIDHIVLQRKKD